jgi:HAD superfamily hydrolase (TIGR01509 family)
MFDEYLQKKKEEGGRSERGDRRPFEDSDYRDYVDGKPRYDGVKDFLASRHISLPYGSKDDSPDAETICGLGNKKNNYFLEILRNKGPEVYDDTVEFIESLRQRGVKAAIISSSRNCAEVLRATRTQHLFDARVDGKDLDSLKIPGKPDPSMFLEAAKRINAKPEHSAIVEDSLAGMEAGKRGKFGLVIGVARSGKNTKKSEQAKKLEERGADVVVSDMKELELDDDDGQSSLEEPIARKE